ncbi:MAG: DUF3313 family protein [Xanthomonadales bacterium]|nr:DUF3313 family protein [Xanthomonadales bacterium]
MKSIKSVLILFALMMVVSTGWAKKNLPAVNADGMELVKNTRLTTVYADPGVDLSAYTEIMLADVSVAFRKNWKRDQNSISRGRAIKVKDSDMELIKERLATDFRAIFMIDLRAGGYQFVDSPGESVLIIKPTIVDLDVITPDIKGPSRSVSYSDSAGEMTLKLELFDSITNDKIVVIRDRKKDFGHGSASWWTGDNVEDAHRIITAWANAFRQGLDEARGSLKQ